MAPKKTKKKMPRKRKLKDIYAGNKVRDEVRNFDEVWDTAKGEDVPVPDGTSKVSTKYWNWTRDDTEAWLGRELVLFGRTMIVIKTEATRFTTTWIDSTEKIHEAQWPVEILQLRKQPRE